MIKKTLAPSDLKIYARYHFVALLPIKKCSQGRGGQVP